VIALSSSFAVACPVDERSLAPIQVVIGSGGDFGEAGSGGDAGGAGSNGDAGRGEGGNDSGGGGSAANGGAQMAGSAGKGGSAGSGGSGASGGAGKGGSASGAGGVAGKGGSAGVCGTGGAPEPRCPDLDLNGVPDCDETIVENPTFDTDADAWQAEENVATAWENADAHDNDESGSLLVENQIEEDRDGGSMLGVRQCFEASAGVFYRFAVEVKVPESAPATQGGFQLLAYDGVACAGTVVKGVSSSLVRGSGWNVTELTYPAPEGTQSIALRLVSVKPYRESPVEVLFDNVLVRTD
jgi:hypothetical protein